MNQTIHSANKEELAALPLKLNLQLFADEVTDADETETDTDITDTEEEEGNDDTSQDEPDTGENDSDLADQKPERDLERDKSFAEMRRKAEEAEKRASQVEAQRQRDTNIAKKYGADYGVFSDADIAAKYGNSHGISTLEQFEQALQREQYQQAGLPPELVDKLSKVDDVLQWRDQQQAQLAQQQLEQTLVSNYEGLTKEYPDLVKAPGDIPAEVWTKWNDGKSGISLTDAYEIVNKSAIRDHIAKSTKQAALNNINGKKHMRPNGGEGGDDIDASSVPDDVMMQYERMFAKELKTGKMTRADFAKHYKKSNGK